MRKMRLDEDYSDYRFFAIVLEVQNRYTRRKIKVKRGLSTVGGDVPKVTDMLALIKDDKQVGNCSVFSVEELTTREEYLKIEKA